MCVCTPTEEGEELESPRCRCNPGPSATLRQLRAGPARGSDRAGGGGGWELLTPLAFFCEAELVIWTENWIYAQRSLGSEAARGRVSQRGRGAELRMTNMFSSSLTVLIHFSVISLGRLDSSRCFIDSFVNSAYQSILKDLTHLEKDKNILNTQDWMLISISINHI